VKYATTFSSVGIVIMLSTRQQRVGIYYRFQQAKYATLLKIQASWDMTLCRWMSSSRRSEGSYALIFWLDCLTLKMKALRSCQT